MGIDLGGGDVGMAEHHLDRPQVGAMAEEMAGEGVADHMGRDFLGDARHQCRFAEDLPESQPGHAGAAAGDEEIVAPPVFQNQRPGGLQIVLDLLPCLFAKGDEPFFIALTEDPDKTGAEITRGERQSNQFGHPQTSRIKGKEHGVIPGADRGLQGWRGEQAEDLRLRQGLGQGFAAAWQVDRGKGVMLGQAFPRQKIVK
jgi:hypothetical protein